VIILQETNSYILYFISLIYHYIFFFISVQIDFVTQNYVGCNLSWSQFIDIINRKCEQISRQKRQKLESQFSDISANQETVQKSNNKNKKCHLTLTSPRYGFILVKSFCYKYSIMRQI